jgi:hypothetical protein
MAERTPEQRGQEAIRISSSPVLQDAVNATQEWAMGSFSAASTPDEAWNARLRAGAVEEFVAYLLAVITMGRNATDAALKQRDKLSERKKRKESVVAYLDRARKARIAFDAEQEEVANG